MSHTGPEDPSCEAIAVRDVRPGDYLNLEDDAFADPMSSRDADGTSNNHILFENVYVEVDAVVPETPGCTMLSVLDVDGFGFPPGHIVYRHVELSETGRLAYEGIDA